MTVLSSRRSDSRLSAIRDARRRVEWSRAEIILGRGSFTESFPLFGYKLDQYELLFEEKLDLFAALLQGGPVTWSGKTRSPLTNQRVFPIPDSGTLNTWIGVGGSPESVVRAAKYGLPLVLAIIGGDPRRFSQYVALYHRALDQFGIERPADRGSLAGARRRHR